MVMLVGLAALAGCFGDGEDAVDDVQDVLPPVLNVNETAPPDLAPVIPPCALFGEEISVPQGPGSPRPEGPVSATLKTDAYGVTHIYAEDLYALWYANGYVQARDRLFQMDVLRHVGYADSASFLGAGQLGSDMQVARDLYSEAEMQAQLDTAPTEIQEALQAYADGVNRFLVEATVRNNLPGEFAAVGHAPETWTPLDSVALIDYLIGYFGVGGGAELGNAQRLAQLNATLGPEEAWKAFADLSWLQADHTYTTIPATDKPVNGCEAPPVRDAVPADQMALAAAARGAAPFGIPESGEPGLRSALFDGKRTGQGVLDGFHWGSNALLVNGSHTATGLPIMFGAPQMGYYKPPVPYQVGLHGAGFDAAGFGVTGAPGIVIGRNNDLAWSVTSGIDDQVDTFAVPFDAAAGTYEWDGESRSAECRDVTHRVLPTPAGAAGGATDPPVKYTQRVCRVEGFPVVAVNPDAGVAWVQRTSTRNEELSGAWMWLNVARMGSFDDVQALMATFPFTFNFNVASADGIGYLHTGDVPLRAAAFDPRLPAPGGSASAWTGEAYTGAMDTWDRNPSTGYYANWNNAPAYGWRTGDSPQNWGTAHRVQALDAAAREVLDRTGNNVTWEDVRLINELAATRDSYALHFTPHLIAAARASGDAALAPLADALQAWQDASLPWRDLDGDGLYDDSAHAIYDRSIVALMDLVVGDELGGLAPTLELDPREASDAHAGDHGHHDNDYSVLADALTGRSGHAWCDDATTPATETCQDQLLAALRAAQANLTEEFGADVAAWLMPQHMSQFTAIGGSNPDLIPMVNRGSWVQVVAFGQGLAGAGSVLPPSNTGFLNPLELALYVGGAQGEPARLTAELQLYVDFEYKPFPLTTDEVDSVAVTTEELTILAPPA